MKTNKVTQYLFRRQIIGLFEMYAFLFVAFLILPFIFSLISGSLSDYSLAEQMRGNLDYGGIWCLHVCDFDLII
jgi:hypothetical protein